MVVGVGYFSEFISSFSDVFGGRSEKLEARLNELNDMLLMKLEQKAKGMNADAIVSVKIDFDEITGKHKQMFMATGYGTAVRLSVNIESKNTYGLGAYVRDHLSTSRNTVVIDDLIKKCESGDTEDLWTFADIIEKLNNENIKTEPKKLIKLLYYKNAAFSEKSAGINQETMSKFFDALTLSANDNNETLKDYLELNHEIYSQNPNALNIALSVTSYFEAMGEYLEPNYKIIAENISKYPPKLSLRIFADMILKGQSDYNADSIEDINILLAEINKLMENNPDIDEEAKLKYNKVVYYLNQVRSIIDEYINA